MTQYRHIVCNFRPCRTKLLFHENARKMCLTLLTFDKRQRSASTKIRVPKCIWYFSVSFIPFCYAVIVVCKLLSILFSVINENMEKRLVIKCIEKIANNTHADKKSSDTWIHVYKILEWCFAYKLAYVNVMCKHKIYAQIETAICELMRSVRWVQWQ